MKKTDSIGLLTAALLTMLGCSRDARLEETLTEILPPEAQIALVETCSELLGASVALFSVALPPASKRFHDQSVNGLWMRTRSLQEFAQADADGYRGAGVSATILDSKECLRNITDDADTILFGEKAGLYYRSENREIVAIIFDEPSGRGVMFLQAP
ncbi:MAG: hypothetical protein AB3N15_06170 [Paracoccaceae bacterium]